MKIDKEILQKAERYCAKAERSPYDVKLFLQKRDVKSEAIITEIINRLKANNFLNEERYIKAFIHDKFKLNKWGKYKIKLALLAKGFGEEKIEKCMAETIDPNEYIDTLKNIMEKKKKTLKIGNRNILKQKISNFAVSKGYEPGLVKKIVESIMN